MHLALDKCIFPVNTRHSFFYRWYYSHGNVFSSLIQLTGCQCFSILYFFISVLLLLSSISTCVPIAFLIWEMINANRCPSPNHCVYVLFDRGSVRSTTNQQWFKYMSDDLTQFYIFCISTIHELACAALTKHRTNSMHEFATTSHDDEKHLESSRLYINIYIFVLVGLQLSIWNINRDFHSHRNSRLLRISYLLSIRPVFLSAKNSIFLSLAIPKQSSNDSCIWYTVCIVIWAII